MLLDSFDLPTDLLTALASLGISSDFDLLFNFGSSLEIWRRLPPGLISLQEFERCTKDALAQASAVGVTCDKLYAQAVESSQMKLGLPALDAVLGGVFGPRRVLEISGDHGSGKSLLALRLVCQHLCDHPTDEALWIDTTGDFSPSRVVRILKACGAEATGVLERLQVALAFDTNTVYEYLDPLIDGTNTQIRFIVIDSVTPLLGPDLSAVSSEGHSTMATFVRKLRAIAQRHDSSILVINTTTSMPNGVHNPSSNFTTTTRKPALGPTFTALVDSTLWLSRQTQEKPEGDNTRYVAEVFKSRSSQSRKWCLFGIEDGVLVE